MNVKSLKSKLLLMLFWLTPSLIFAQQNVSGKVVDENNQPLSGASVTTVKSKRQAITGHDGKFRIEVLNDDKMLVASVGFLQKQVLPKNDETIVLEKNVTTLSDVVVTTALGIKKEKRKLGYAVQEVKGEDLIKAREPNPINSLVGKVAGLTVGINSELLAAPNMLLRGRGISLYVVDGVPINSDTWNISPDDIESYTVLKGATASALYGSRGLNGAIMITTKRGSKDKRGYSIEFNSSTMFEKGFNAIPKVQDLYGPGDHGQYKFVDGKGGGENDGDYDVWGPKFEGQLIDQYDSPIDPVTGKRKATPWVARGKDNLQRFLQTGILTTNNIAVSSNNDKADLRFSLTHTYQRGIVPNTKLNIANFNVSAGYNFTNQLRLESYLNYNRQFTPNIPDVVYGPNSIIYNITLWAGADWNIDDMKNYWQPGKEGVQSIYAEYQRYHNPYFMSYEWLRGHYKNDVNGYAKLSYKINSNWDMFIRTQASTYELFRSEKMPYSAHPYGREEGRGDYREDKRSLFENNTDLLATYTNNKLTKELSLKASVGGNIRSFTYNSSFVTTDYLNVPGLYVFSNSRNPIKATSFSSKMLVLSAYGNVDLGISKYANIALAGRVDKLSTLTQGNNIYFYPSVAASTVLSDYITMPSKISFLKLRASFAKAKGGLTSSTIGTYPQASSFLGYGSEYYSSYDGPTYENSASYATPITYDNKAAAYFTNTINNNGLKPFNTDVYEAGFDMRLFKNVLGLEATFFLTNDGPGIFKLPISQTTGYTEALVNGITTRKTGVELTLQAKLINSNSPNKLGWNASFNWSTFTEKYTSFYNNSSSLNTFFKINDRTDKLYGSAFAKTEDGKIIYDAAGKPLTKPVAQFLGNMNPDWVWGLNNTFTYKNFSLNIQFDGRVGGNMINYIQQQTFRGGRHIATVEGAMGISREKDTKGEKSWLGNGVNIENGTKIEYDVDGNITNYKNLTYVTNANKTFLQDYISSYYRVNEANLISKTFAKLREVVITYNVPSNLLGKGFFKQANVSFVARNLLYFSKYKDLDIDQYPGTNASSSLQTPTTKRYGININLTF